MRKFKVIFDVIEIFSDLKFGTTSYNDFIWFVTLDLKY